MQLSSDLISQFVKNTKDDTKKQSETTMYGTVEKGNDGVYVRFDGSDGSPDTLTPVSTTADVQNGERVTVLLKDHSATIIGDLNVPSARSDTVNEVSNKVNNIIIQTAKIEELEADNVIINERLEANEAAIKKLDIDSLTAEEAKVIFATIEKLEATNINVENLESEYGKFKTLATDKIEAIEGTIDELDATYATISELEVERGRINNLDSNIADIDTLMFGSATGNTLQTSFANAVVALLGDAQIKSAMIDSVSANKITSGDIITNNVNVKSNDGKLLISDETIQISDLNRVRVQIGKDASGDYSINIWDTNGNLMFSKGGITDSAIKDAIIRNDMVSDDANIAAHKLDIDSLFEEINGSSKTIKSTRVYLDEENQSLDIAFKSIITDITELQNGVESQGTQISAIQGQISSKIWQQDIDITKNELGEQTEELSTKYTALDQKVDGFQSTVSSTYATKTELSEIEVGGRNLLINTGGNELVSMSNGGDPIVSAGVNHIINSSGVTTMNCNTSTQEIYYRFMTPVDSTNNLYGLEPGKQYTISGKAKVITLTGELLELTTRVQYYNVNSGWYDNDVSLITDKDATEWVDFTGTFTVDKQATGIYISIQLYYTDSWSGAISLKHLQLEKGNKKTAWSMAPEDFPTVELVSSVESKAEAAQYSVDNLSIGGKNLLKNTKIFQDPNISGSSIISEETYKDFYVRTKDYSEATEGYTDMISILNIYPEKLGEEYTLSFYAKGNGKLVTYFYGPTGYIRTIKCVQSNGNIKTSSVDGATEWVLTDNWNRYWVTWTLANEGDISISKWILFRLYFGSKADICGVKLEKGNRATDWTPAPEDVENDISIIQATAEAAQLSANKNAEDMANIVTTFNNDITSLQTQIDGSITTWFYEVAPANNNEPSVNWTTTDLKNVHLGDLYYDTITGYCYRYQVKNNIYSWQRITDTDVTKALADAQTAKDTADQKRRVFYIQPTAPYDAGDLWVQGSSGDILRCQTSKINGQSYSSSDWVPASKYTDDTKANLAQSTANAAQTAANTAQSDIDNLKIGGRNLIFNSKGDNTIDWTYPAEVVVDSVKGYCIERTNVTVSSEKYIGSTRTGIIEPATEYTFSADIWCNEKLKSFDLFWLSDTEDEQKTGAGYINIKSNANNNIAPNKWTRVIWTFTTHSNDRTGFIRIDNNGSTEEGVASILRVANLKLEKGNRATDWTIASEDLENRIKTAETKILQNGESITLLANRTTIVENKFAGYSTTESMNSAIEQKANSIISSVNSSHISKAEFNNLEIGGRNLVAGTSKLTEYSGNASGTTNGYRDVWTGKTIDIPVDTEYIVSFDAKADVAQTIRCHFYSPNTTTGSLSSTGQSGTGADGSIDVTITTEWKRYWVKWTQTPATTVKNIIVGRNTTSNDIYIRAVKFETGNKATAWSPAPEDMATGDALDTVESSAGLMETRIATSETIIQQLSDCIATLVTDGNGESLMAQTSNGWTFSTGDIQNIVNNTSENLENLTNEMGDVNSAVDVLKQAVDDLGILNEYVKIGTYENEPCIELGENDSDFKLVITNTRIMFMEGTGVPAYLNNQSLFIKKAVIEEELQQGQFIWKVRNNGNLGLIWKGAE